MRKQHENFDHELKIGRSFSGQERHCAFLNLGNRSFANVSSVTGLDHIEDGRALALSDWDLDGDVDFLLTNRNAPMFRFLVNKIDSGNHFISFKLTGSRSNRDAIGARIRVKPSGGDWLTKTVTAGSGFLSQSSKRIVFGLGTAEQIDQIEMLWPDGTNNILEKLKVDQHYNVKQTQGAPEVETFTRPVTANLQAGGLTWQSPEAITTYVVPPIRMPLTDMQNTKGSKVRIDFENANNESRYTLLNLWASWCEPCKIELASSSQLQNVPPKDIYENIECLQKLLQ